MKGTATFPYLLTMTGDTAIKAIEGLVEQILEGNEDVFLVSVRIKPTNNIRVYLDADTGLSIEKCIPINRALYKAIEEKGWYPDGNFSLEVSSPGVDEPLKMMRQYKKNIGRKVQVVKKDDTKQEGKLVNVTDESVTVEYTEGKNKKAVVVSKDIPFEEIKQTTVVIAF
jgi:ribosome maturation factor RimP